MPVETTHDAYLDGRITVEQPKEGYRAGSDAVMLAAAVQAKSGQSVLELGMGAGAVAKCLLWRVPEIAYFGVERVETFVELALRNLDAAGHVVHADIADLPETVAARSFDHVIFNPPYYESAGRGEHALKMQAHVEETALSDWVSVARKRLKPKGHLTIIHRVERLADVMVHLHGFGHVTVLPIAARSGHAAKRILVQARKATKGASQLLAPFVMHDGDAHQGDGDDYSDAARQVLRDGAAIIMKK